jgi:anti-sigma B factor antagonist
MSQLEPGPDDHHIGFSVHAAESPDGAGTIVTVIGELDLQSAPALRRLLQRAADGGGAVTVDMRACNFVDSTGIAALVEGARRLSGDDRVLVIKGAQERVRRILELAGLLSHKRIVLKQD